MLKSNKVVLPEFQSITLRNTRNAFARWDNTLARVYSTMRIETRSAGIITYDTYIDAFINSAAVTLNQKKICSVDDFKRSLGVFALEHDIYDGQYYSPPFTVQKALQNYGIKEVTDASQSYFVGIQLNRIEPNTCSIDDFLKSSVVVLDPSKYCPLDVFTRALRDFERHIGIIRKRKRMHPTFKEAFARFNITCTRDVKEYRGENKRQEYLIGVDLVPCDDLNL